MTPPLRLLLLTTLFFVIWEEGYGQTKSVPVTSIESLIGSRNSSLPHQEVRHVLPLQDGRLFISTVDGIAFFDGYDLQSLYVGGLDVPGYGTLSLRAIEAIQSRTGSIWIAVHHSGILVLSETGDYQHFVPSDSLNLRHPNIYALLEDQQGRIWTIPEGGGIDIIDPVTYQVQRIGDSVEDPFPLSNYSTTFLFLDSRGIVWVGTKGGGVMYVNADTNFIPLPGIIDALPACAEVISIAQGNNILLFGCGDDSFVEKGGGIVLYDLERQQIIASHDLKHSVLDVFWHQETGFLAWTDTLFEINPIDQKVRALQGPARLQYSTFPKVKILRDYMGSVWIVSSSHEQKYDALFRFIPGGQEYTRVEPIIENAFLTKAIFNAHVDGYGVLWLSPFYGGLVKVEYPPLQFEEINEPTIRNDIDEILALEDGWFVVTTWKRTENACEVHLILRGVPESRSSYTCKALGIANNQTRSLYHDTQTRSLWIGTTREAIRIDYTGYEEEQLQLAVETTRVYDEQGGVLDFVADRWGNLWLGTVDQGLWRINEEDELTSWNDEFLGFDGYRETIQVSSLEIDSKGNILVGTNAAGLYSLNISTNKAEQLIHRGAFSEIVHDDGLVLAGTVSDGLYVLTHENGRLQQEAHFKESNIESIIPGRPGDYWLFNASSPDLYRARSNELIHLGRGKALPYQGGSWVKSGESTVMVASGSALYEFFNDTYFLNTEPAQLRLCMTHSETKDGVLIPTEAPCIDEQLQVEWIEIPRKADVLIWDYDVIHTLDPAGNRLQLTTNTLDSTLIRGKGNIRIPVEKQDTARIRFSGINADHSKGEIIEIVLEHTSFQSSANRTGILLVFLLVFCPALIWIIYPFWARRRNKTKPPDATSARSESESDAEGEGSFLDRKVNLAGEEPIRFTSALYATEIGAYEPLSEEDRLFRQGIIEYINSQISDAQFGVGMLASHFNITERHLLRKVQDVFGNETTTQKLITTCRVLRARQLIMENPRREITTIAKHVGYGSAKALRDPFKSQFGISPSLFRRKQKPVS